jgi:tripartite-type tricarboxylate transporter receptor subunit TctC
MKALSSTPRTSAVKRVNRVVRGVAIAGFAALLGAGAPMARIPFPEQALVIVVPAPRGGGTDLFARQLAALVEKDFGQRIIIDNRPRDGGMVGVSHMTRATPDGYTVAFVWNSPLTVAPLFSDAGFQPRDYRAVMSIGYSSYVLCVRPDFPASDAKGMFEALSVSPNSYSYGNDGATGTMRLAAERIFEAAGVSVRGVAFSGATETARNFIAGTVDIYSGSLSAILPHVEAGLAKCLLLTSAEGNTAVPQASGLAALGFAELETVLWWGLIAPAGVPDEAIARLEKAFLEAANSEAFAAVMASSGAVWRPRGATETGSMIAAEIEAFEALTQRQ